MNKLPISILMVAVAAATVLLPVQQACSQEVSLVPLNSRDVAKGYRASTLKLKEVTNDKGEMIGTVDDFIFSKEGSIFVILSVGDFISAAGALVAVPFRSLKLDDPSRIIVPGASREALSKLPVFLYNR